jgi:NAD(P)-dependent dehydrogenase (short-subunit alcohol dehydrogenase family)
MKHDLSNRHVVVTGGGGALGRAVVGAALEAGASVHVPIYNAVELADHPHSDDDRVRFVEGVDLTSESDAERFFSGVDGLWGSVHCAGGFAMKPIGETSIADLRRMLGMNVISAYLSCREAVKHMRRTGRGGRIVNISAAPALDPAGGMTAYSASKAAVANLTQCLSKELEDDHIFVNAIVPVIIDTPANREAMPDADHSAWTDPEEIAETILHLISPQNEATTGSLVRMTRETPVA